MESVCQSPVPLDAEICSETTANSLLQKYDGTDLQELLSMTTCSWLFGGGEHSLHLDKHPGIIPDPNITILAPIDSRIPLDYKVVHQIVRELTVGIYGFNQLPVISLEPNYDQSSTCQLPPAYYDTKVGQVLINIDYTMKTLWHGCYFPREKRVVFSDLWKNRMGVNADGLPQTKKDIHAEFLNAGPGDSSVEESLHQQGPEPSRKLKENVACKIYRIRPRGRGGCRRWSF
nr:ankyrin and armadillo repeat-containing protein-like [Misgurnus anguillicaudatus]